MEMCLNDPSGWGIRYAGADTLRISAEEISVKLYIKQIKIDPAVYRTLTASFNGGKIASYPVVRGAVRTYAHPMDNSGTFEGTKILPEKVTYACLAPSHSR